MSTHTFSLHPDPEFISILSECLPHKKIISRFLPNGTIQDETLRGTNFMEDILRVYQSPSDLILFKASRENKEKMWSKFYIDETQDFLQSNNFSIDLLDNFWLLRCRIAFLYEDAWWAERNRHGHESEQTKRINFLHNHVLPFIKAIQGDAYLSHQENNVQSVTFKTNKPGVKTLKLTGHLANNIYLSLQEMTYSFLEMNKDHNPDLQTNRLRAGIGEITVGSYNTLRQYGLFKQSPQSRPNSEELTILENLIDLGTNCEGLISKIAPNSSTTEYLRKFFY